MFHAFIILISQVFGKKPFEHAPSLPTAELAKLIVRQYNLNDEQLALYTRHVAILVSYYYHLTYREGEYWVQSQLAVCMIVQTPICLASED